MGYDLRGAVKSLFSRRYEGYSQTWPGSHEYLVVSTVLLLLLDTSTSAMDTI